MSRKYHLIRTLFRAGHASKEIPVSEALTKRPSITYCISAGWSAMQNGKNREKQRNEEIDAGITSGLLQAVCENNKRP